MTREKSYNIAPSNRSGDNFDKFYLSTQNKTGISDPRIARKNHSRYFVA
jgi:hypothetical protein